MSGMERINNFTNEQREQLLITTFVKYFGAWESSKQGKSCLVEFSTGRKNLVRLIALRSFIAGSIAETARQGAENGTKS